MKVDLDKMHLPVKVGGLTFRNPFYVGSGPTTKSIDHLVKAAEIRLGGASIKLTFDPEPYVSLEPRYGWWDDQGFLSFSAESRLNVEEGLRLVEEGRRRTPKDFLIMANITYVGDKPGVHRLGGHGQALRGRRRAHHRTQHVLPEHELQRGGERQRSRRSTRPAPASARTQRRSGTSSARWSRASRFRSS